MPGLKLTQGETARRGTVSAPVSIVEFSDFDCPFCKRLTDELEGGVFEQEAGKVSIIFRNFPLSMHPWAKDAAELAECARMQRPDAFWIMHDAFFSEQAGLQRETIRALADRIAQRANLKMEMFYSCMDRAQARGAVEQDLELGKKMGVHGTPTLFVNGALYSVPRDRASLIRMIDGVAQGKPLSDYEMPSVATTSPTIRQLLINVPLPLLRPRRRKETGMRSSFASLARIGSACVAIAILPIAYSQTQNVGPHQLCDQAKHLMYSEPSNFTQAMALLETAQQQGSDEASAMIGSFYFYGYGVAKDTQRVFALEKPLADRGVPGGELYLGLLYREGSGVPRDLSQAAILIERAATQGFAPAITSLGDLYAHGEGVPRDRHKSIQLWRTAGELGDLRSGPRGRVFVHEATSPARFHRMRFTVILNGNWLGHAHTAGA